MSTSSLEAAWPLPPSATLGSSVRVSRITNANIAEVLRQSWGQKGDGEDRLPQLVKRAKKKGGEITELPWPGER